MTRRARCSHRRTTRDQRGAVAVEAALVLPILFTLLFGIIELSLLVRDQISVASSVRVGSRAATTTGAVVAGPGVCETGPSAPPCTPASSPALAQIAADAIQRNGMSMPKSAIDYVLVFKANDKGYPGANGNSTMPSSCTGVTNCVMFKWNDASEKFRYFSGAWASTSINACAGEADAVGIYLHATHKWVSGLFRNAIGVDDRAVSRFEPLSADTCKSTSPFPHS
ncbi:TadE/TadG family type IV pilus assembly protein [Nocardioides sp. URHA0020]|uniref:TadE/TadG family type IV pilus assembly protein n=1 Tax=Nocardioides sp. URHA0020 TaxID=1380392 RepID=UPI0006890819|nr:TadE/TadG family type IV pilus assembly protein [Nocardioides sp. URHA0020]